MQLQSAKCFAAVAGLALGTVGSLCTATDTDTTVGDPSGALQEIVVTARRQNEDLEKVPRGRRRIVDLGAYQSSTSPMSRNCRRQSPAC